MERYWLLGFKGDIRKILSKEDISFGDIKVPLIEIVTGEIFPTEQLRFNHIGVLGESLMLAVKPAYQQWNKFGPYGDIIQITRDNDHYMIDFIGRLAFHKPALAADLVPIIVDRTGNIYFVGIERRDTPGLPALIGGHMDIHGFHLETAAEAVLHEAAEEAALIIIPEASELERIQKKPDADNISVTVEDLLGKIHVKSTLIRLGRFQTSDQEKMASVGLKRVYETVAYGLKIKSEMINPDYFTEWFKAGDDAKNMQIWNITKNGPPKKFAFDHHKTIFFKALRKLIDGR